MIVIIVEGGDYIDMGKIYCGIYMIKNKVNKKVYIGQSTNIKVRWRNHRSFAFNDNNKDDKIYHSHLYRSFRKNGLINFEFIILEECDKFLLDERELYYIKKYNSEYPKFGYNNTSIINSIIRNTKWNQKTFDEVKKMLRDFNLSIKDIAEYFNVDVATIHYINRGDFLTDLTENYPIRDKYEYNKFIKSKREGFKNDCVFCKKIFIKENSSYFGKYCSKECMYNDNAIFRLGITKDKLESLIIFNSFEEIGRMFDVSGKAVTKWCKKLDLPYKRSDINEIYKDKIIESNNNLIRPCKTRLNYPSLQEIINFSFKCDSFKNISEQFGINDSSLRWYCKKNGIPTNIEELRNFKI